MQNANANANADADCRCIRDGPDRRAGVYHGPGFPRMLPPFHDPVDRIDFDGPTNYHR